MNTITRTTAVLSIGIAATFAASAPAFAGQVYPAPGFPSGHASCVGAAMNFEAHYGGEDDSFPVITHGSVGPNISAHATSDGPGAVGAFESALAQNSGPVWLCLP
ncbi:MAG: hypothetical protein QOG49_537 [Frankiaceae bacterium]|jgi:hypothetical protein|nr:hypothetical protein [Frankiaceae bacterium]